MNPSPRMPRSAWVVLCVGIGLVVLAVLLWGAAPSEFGWFSYGPVDEEFLSRLLFMSGRRWASVASALSGLLQIAGVVGFRLGFRRGAAERTT